MFRGEERIIALFLLMPISSSLLAGSALVAAELPRCECRSTALQMSWERCPKAHFRGQIPELIAGHLLSLSCNFHVCEMELTVPAMPASEAWGRSVWPATHAAALESEV